jgi:amino acid adenylation domain-containing protein
MKKERALWTGFMRSAELFPDRPAVIAEGKTLTYKEMRESACRIAATIQTYQESSATPLTAVLGYRTPTAFAGILGSLLAGNGYVPLNRTFPVDRTRMMFEQSECKSIVADARSVPQLESLLEKSHNELLVVLPEIENVEALQDRWPRHTFAGSSELSLAHKWQEREARPNVIAYLLFTSGSTGIPKGVMIAHRNVTAFLDYMVDRYEITESDRLSQMFDMTFDLSVFDMFASWERGACVCCPSQKALINPGKFIQDMELTIWFSVPSTVAFMKKLGSLKPGRYPSLRFSLFCGEPLPVSSASAWLEAAPNSTLENLYGPTELTIACALYRWNPVRSPAECEMDLVPIGYPYPGMNVLVADQNLHEVCPAEEGELLMNGPQISAGYWKDSRRTESAFVVPAGRAEIFYRTGDRVRRPVNNGPLTFLGRIDDQVKILGHRVELGEIEAVVRKRSGLDGVAAIGWPVTASGHAGIEVFIEGETKGYDELRNAIASELPDYMVPRRIHFMGRLPRNANDKLDRKAMRKMLEEGL